MNTMLILALIQALTKEVNLLELQLAQLQASSSVQIASYNHVGSQGQTATTSEFSVGGIDLRTPYLTIPAVNPKGIHYSTEGTKFWYGNEVK